ncbi:30S ribosomal protein S7 [Candidatus Portiera aleyrodidarum]|uniref:Small ribosomal subunit protein uS7 n=1 Tax=Candidatus Portiera aleyrodidarum MED (Bemisia tabaci) TaxID=1163752 RepID=A0AAU8RR62_9GAMM|nr:30S ribosomal protein S7 [Candidatus Portiera aleyrodidarum]AFQ24041.1 SSU ribosomal protein S7P [Candidatus Portiera aleyrodidarum BT-B-HRs]AFS18805.1 30S ribosomal protein S7 [Candidatus Portiera aleyrodidarum BT-QVLC]AFT80431.1 SSU ribosomal protein S7p (S5e) [Candidatus Portiera aleyrodidarum BT-QVLC]AFT80712.1 SSU ribosomal protein S7p (S5e) [Candidatus Portiera aleyrodidarum BT-B-HRs]AJF24018.1 30S ribosomal protein S7 [Candidatus Portiera aleyrodidarum MED (Bemisia tabaci)]
MSRRNIARKREKKTDNRFKSVRLAKFINHIMLNGKKELAERIVYGALNKINKVFKKNIALSLFEKALESIKPMVEVKTRRIGGANYNIPVEIRSERRDTLAMKWLVKASRDRHSKKMKIRLYEEILDAIEGKGLAIKKKEEIHRMAEANKAFAHYRF